MPSVRSVTCCCLLWMMFFHAFATGMGGCIWTILLFHAYGAHFPGRIVSARLLSLCWVYRCLLLPVLCLWLFASSASESCSFVTLYWELVTRCR
uniref:Conotoxin Di14.1 n=1 Tax=Conus distans TaxID=72281 RepID=M9PNF6_CONDI|nr:conotoxin Di14.1 [Conus distans]